MKSFQNKNTIFFFQIYTEICTHMHVHTHTERTFNYFCLFLFIVQFVPLLYTL